MTSKKRVAYYYDQDAGDYYYGPGHPMKPHRLKLTHHLLLAYDLYSKMDVFRPHVASREEMIQFHSKEYVDFLSTVSPHNVGMFEERLLQKYNCGDQTDCPIFDGIGEYCATYSGGSIDGATRLNHGLADVCVNWSGGLHHAKKGEASGFCYINDIVLAILELLKFHPRVLYIDIDIHHGDGVEEAFYTADRVMTVSFHKYGDFFPGTGALHDVGHGRGKYYSINVPLNDGVDDDAFLYIFKPVINKIMEVFDPGAVVLQCGADSLTGDRLGCFNVTLNGHGEAVKYVQSFNRPLLVLGGGGYTIRNVSRCWAYETSVILGCDVTNDIPHNDYLDFWAPDYKLHLTPSVDMPNRNSKQDLDRIKNCVLENLSYLHGAPCTQMTEAPPDHILYDEALKIVTEGGQRENDERNNTTAGEEPHGGGDDGAEGATTSKRQHESEFYADRRDQDGDSRGAYANPPAEEDGKTYADGTSGGVVEVKGEVEASAQVTQAAGAQAAGTQVEAQKSSQESLPKSGKVE